MGGGTWPHILISVKLEENTSTFFLFLSNEFHTRNCLAQLHKSDFLFAS